MSAHVLLNLLKELGKRDKMRGLPSILTQFRNEFNKLQTSGIQLLPVLCKHKVDTLNICIKEFDA